MRSIHLYICVLLIFTFFPLIATAQVQNGIVRTLARPDKKSQGLGGVTITILEAPNSVVSSSTGQFSVPLLGKKEGDPYIVGMIQKNDYTLVDKGIRGRQLGFSSKVPLEIVMVSNQQLEEDKRYIEEKANDRALKRYRKQQEELEQLRKEKHITDEEYTRTQLVLGEKYEHFMSLVDKMAETYALMDYEGISDINKQIRQAIENAELEKADSLLLLKGNFEQRKQQGRLLIKAGKEMTELGEQKTQEGTDILNDLAQDYYYRHTIFASNYQNDSAAYYLEQRVSIDSTNVDWLNDAGDFISEYLADDNKALSYYQCALTYARMKYSEESALIASIINRIGICYFSKNEYSLALDYYSKALEIRESVYEPNHPEIAQSYNNLACSYDRKGDFSLALEYFNKALSIWLKVYGENHSDVALAYNQIGSMYVSLGNYTQALEYHKKALEIHESLYGTEHKEVAYSYIYIGSAYSNLSDHTRALNYYKKALAINEKVYGPNHPEVAKIYNDLGVIYDKINDSSHALEYQLKALEIRQKVFGANHTAVATSCNNIACVYISLRDYQLALKYAMKALQIDEKVLGKEHPDVATVYHTIGEIYARLRDFVHALEYYFKALAILENTLGENHPHVSTTYRHIGRLYLTQGLYDNALEYYTKVLSLQETNYGKESREVANCCDIIGFIYKHLGNNHKALTFHKRSLGIKYNLSNESAKNKRKRDSIMYQIAQMYEQGTNSVGLSIPDAIDWYRMSYQKEHLEEAKLALLRLEVPFVVEKELIEKESDFVGIWLEKNARCGKIFLPNGCFFNFRCPKGKFSPSDIYDCNFVPNSMGRYKLINQHGYEEELERHTYSTQRKGSVINYLGFTTFDNIMVIYFANDYKEHWEKQSDDESIIKHIMGNWDSYMLYIQDKLK